MPLYNYKCPSNDCEHEFSEIQSIADRESCPCPNCGILAEQQLSAPPSYMFKEGWWEHIGPEPIYVKSKSQLRDECEKNDCIATGEL